MRFLALALLFLVSAAQAGTEEKIAALMRAQGLNEMFESQFEAMRAEGLKQADQMVRQITGEFDLPEALEAKMRAATDKYVKALHATFTSEEIVAVWSKAYGSKFSEKEIDGLLKYYNSPLGKKDVAATKAAFPAFNGYLLNKTSASVERALADYTADLKALVDECVCKK